MNGGLREKGGRTSRLWGDVDPLEGTTNIVDAMLVFACGLMLALAVYWNIDLGPIGERIDLIRGQEITDTPLLREGLVETEGTGELYERLGTVYKDPRTGQLFMLTEDGGK
ncbi:MAG TPA: DUF2149 domain-containing protein [Firmicutes bacterium]|jgi:hypothetical protein|nr:DUF2149 domain-containing protein [Bacillota bacterium]